MRNNEKLNFNSIKVRLEHIHSLVDLSRKLFQFHKGTIRTVGWAKKRYYNRTISIP